LRAGDEARVRSAIGRRSMTMDYVGSLGRRQSDV
jgi:hypothetical protein